MVRHTQEDREATKTLRKMRLKERNDTKEMNPFGKRIQWCREMLELGQNEVCEATGIPPSSYHGRECGQRTDFWEEMLMLAAFFNREWRIKFNGTWPSFNGREMKQITPDWLFFGSDDLAKDAEVLIQEYRIKIANMESDFFYKEAELKRQLNILAVNEQI